MSAITNLIEIETQVLSNGNIWVRARQRTGGTEILAGMFKPTDAPDSISAAIDAYYTDAFAGMAQGVRIIDENR